MEETNNYESVKNKSNFQIPIVDSNSDKKNVNFIESTTKRQIINNNKSHILFSAKPQK